jgi:tellurite methyltransferase
VTDRPLLSWAQYYEITGMRPPRKTLVFALDAFDREGPADAPRRAADLGCGNGRDTIELLRRGWRVLAVDAEPDAIAGLTARTDLPDGALARLETAVSRFEDFELPAGLDLVNSSFALPLLPPPAFPDLWDGILASLRPGGRVSCQLYGDRDSWVGNRTITFFTSGGIEALLHPLDIEMLEEEEDDSTTPRGEPKHWHIFHIVARKPVAE